MEYTTQDLVQFAVGGNAVKAGEAFNDLIADKIASTIQSRKVELAQQIFNNQTDDEDNPYEEDEDEDYEEEESEEIEDEEEEDENS